ncbi:MAG: hypothetical protein HN411_01535 [Waddliaceae bacterium]|jgi:ankyrin repeat protein|nr:hypothetical protein [Waddliaceae bacterium]MBT3578472.1 hypothetical protein [Waddliaceae bacterium]MBT4444948.1 hypothetical protein [Waddliaceae bacterium]MBT6927992.1 hypothetical protein [Waddliaceae bacterium]MBT7263892.1 hypothetical protein [Waddliaceae bacterium]
MTAVGYRERPFAEHQDQTAQAAAAARAAADAARASFPGGSATLEQFQTPSSQSQPLPLPRGVLAERLISRILPSGPDADIDVISATGTLQLYDTEAFSEPIPGSTNPSECSESSVTSARASRQTEPVTGSTKSPECLAGLEEAESLRSRVFRGIGNKEAGEWHVVLMKCEISKTRNDIFELYKRTKYWDVKERCLQILIEIVKSDPLEDRTLDGMGAFMKKIYSQIEKNKSSFEELVISAEYCLLIQLFANVVFTVVQGAALKRLERIPKQEEEEDKDSVVLAAENIAYMKKSKNVEIRYWALYVEEAAKCFSDMTSSKADKALKRGRGIIQAGVITARIATKISGAVVSAAGGIVGGAAAAVAGSAKDFVALYEELKKLAKHIPRISNWLEKLLIVDRMARLTLDDTEPDRFRDLVVMIQQYKHEKHEEEFFHGIVVILENTAIHACNQEVRESAMKLLIQYRRHAKPSIQQQVVSAFSRMAQEKGETGTTAIIVLKYLEAVGDIGQDSLSSSYEDSAIESIDSVKEGAYYDNVITFLEHTLLEIKDAEEYGGYSRGATYAFSREYSKIEALMKCAAAFFPKAFNPDVYGNTIFHIAVKRRDKDAIKIVAQCAPDVIDINAKDYDDEYTALHYAVLSKDVELVRTLIAEGKKKHPPIDLNVKDVRGNTPLHLAVNGDDFKMTELLIAHGVELNIANKEKENPLNIAIRKKHAEIAHLLQTDCDKIKRALKAAGLSEEKKAALRKKIKMTESWALATGGGWHHAIVYEANFNRSVFSVAAQYIELGEVQKLMGATREQGSERFTDEEVKAREGKAVDHRCDKYVMAALQRLFSKAEFERIPKRAKTLQAVSDRIGVPEEVKLTMLDCIDVVEILQNRLNIPGLSAHIYALIMHHTGVEEAGGLQKLFGNTELMMKVSSTVGLREHLKIHGAVDINAKNDFGMTSLHYAVLGGYVESVSILLENGANIDAQNIEGYTPLHLAAIIRNPAIIKLLVEKGADVSAKSIYKDLPIMLFSSPTTNRTKCLPFITLHHQQLKGEAPFYTIAPCSDEDSKTAALLIPSAGERELEDMVDVEKNTVLHHAVACGDIKTVKSLLKQHPGLFWCKNKRGEIPLDVAVAQKKTYLVGAVIMAQAGKNLLGFSSKYDRRTGRNPTFANLLASLDMVEPFRMLHQSNPSIILYKDRSPRKFSPLHVAAREGSRRIVSYYINKNLDTTTCDSHGNTPLIHAVLRKKFNVFNDLVKADRARRLRKDDDCSSVSTQTAWTDERTSLDTETKEQLKDAPLHEIPNKDRRTAMHIAATKGLDKFVDVLIKDGADLTREDSYGDTPLHLAVRYGHLSTAVKLATAEPRAIFIPNQERDLIHTAAMFGHDEIFAFLLGESVIVECKKYDITTIINSVEDFKGKKIVNINARDSFRRTPLMLAAQEGKLNIVETCKKYGAKIDAFDDSGENALHKAVFNRHLKIVIALLEMAKEVVYTTRKRLIRKPDADGEGVLFEAAKLWSHDLDEDKEKELEDICDLILEHGVSRGESRGAPLYDTDDSDEKTFLHLLAHYGLSDLIEHILDKNLMLRARFRAGGQSKKIVDIKKRTLLHSAAEGGDYKTVELLCERGFRADVEDIHGITPLMLAVRKKKYDIARLLREHKARLKRKDAEGETVLHEILRRKALDDEDRRYALELIHSKPKILIMADKANLCALHVLAENSCDPIMLEICLRHIPNRFLGGRKSHVRRRDDGEKGSLSRMIKKRSRRRDHEAEESSKSAMEIAGDRTDFPAAQLFECRIGRSRNKDLGVDIGGPIKTIEDYRRLAAAAPFFHGAS